MKAKSIKGKSAHEIQSELRLSMADGFKPTLAIIFISIKQDRKAVCEILCNENINVFGATSCGEFVNGHQTEGGIVVLLMDIGTTSFHILYEDIGERTIAETAKALAKDALQKFSNPSLIVCSTGVNSKGDFFDGNALVSELEKNLGNDKIFYGGMAGDDVTFTGTHIFTSEKETDHGIIAIVLDAGKISLHGIAITGWKPMGIERVVTKSAGMLLYEIDNRPAVEMYMKYLGKSEKISDKDFDVMNELSLAFPFIAERGDGETIIISPRKIDHEANALVMDVEFAEGSRFWFSCPPDFAIVEE
ncbi:MAG: hypothetical protein JST96_08765, partial [Bacteroidetes bacterium]|nr:hypothetical protein [Bacteroidota bacterium]